MSSTHLVDLMTTTDFMSLKNAIRVGETAIVRKMVMKYGQKILSDQLTKDGIRLLDLAALPPGRKGIAKLIVELGGVISLADEVSSIEVAARNRNSNFLFETLNVYNKEMYNLSLKKFCHYGDVNTLETIKKLLNHGLSLDWRDCFSDAVRYFLRIQQFDDAIEAISNIEDVKMTRDMNALAFIQACRFGEHSIAENLSSRSMNQDFSEKFTHRTKSGLLAEVYLSPLSALKLFGSKIDPKVETSFLGDGGDLDSIFQCLIQTEAEYSSDNRIKVYTLAKFLELGKSNDMYLIEPLSL